MAGVAASFFPMRRTGGVLRILAVLGHLGRLAFALLPRASLLLSLSIVDMRRHPVVRLRARTILLVGENSRQAHRVAPVGRYHGLLGSITVVVNLCRRRRLHDLTRENIGIVLRRRQELLRGNLRLHCFVLHTLLLFLAVTPNLERVPQYWRPDRMTIFVRH